MTCGWQAHVEDLRALLAGREPADWHDRWVELIPLYRAEPETESPKETKETKEPPTTGGGTGLRLLGELRSSDGQGVVIMTERFETDLDDLWSALTDPDRLSRWLGEFDGELRLGEAYRWRFFASGAEGVGRVVSCRPPIRFGVATRAQDETDEQLLELTLSASDGGSVLVLEQRGLPLDWLAAFGAGIQVHVEDLVAHIGGRGRCDSDARMEQLIPAYEGVAVTAVTDPS